VTLRIHDGTYHQSDICALSDGAYRLHFNGMLWCAENVALTDGEINEPAIQTLTRLHGQRGWQRLVSELLAAKLWEKVPERDANLYRICSYRDHNWTRAQRAKYLADNLARVQKHRQKSRTLDPEREAVTHYERISLGTGTGSGTGTGKNPTRQGVGVPAPNDSELLGSGSSQKFSPPTDEEMAAFLDGEL